MERKLSVLITGGSGFIGMKLSQNLLKAGYNVSVLSRKARMMEAVKVFRWDPEKKYISPDALRDVDFIIHLAGANLGKARWSEKRKREILSSRIDPAKLLHDMVIEKGIRLKAFISASATGYYGTETTQKIYTETDPPASDFTGFVCREWEAAADLFNNSGIRTVKIRTAVVIGKGDSAFSKLSKPAKLGFLIKAGRGTQYMPWIHIADLCNIYMKALEDPGMSGAYNAASPENVTHKQFVDALAEALNVPVFPIPVPGFFLKAFLGSMSDIILKGSQVSSEKILATGFCFRYPNLNKALENVIRG